MGKKKSVTIGYRYYFGIHMGLGRGPVDEVLALKVADKEAWSGSITANGSFRISAGNLFGGDKGEGGIDGTAYMLMGENDQQVYGPLASMLGGKVPAFRTRATIYFNGMIAALNPYPKPWSWRIRRILKGWDGDVWYPSKAVIALDGGKIKAMNPAHMLVEAATNRDWGRGLDRGDLHLPSYQAAADTLYAEGFGLCMRWVRQDSVSNFIQLVLDHIGAVQAIDRRTGKLVLKLIRQDYNVANLPVFNFSNGLLAIEDLETAAFDTTTNTIVVRYRDPITNEDRTSAPVQNLAAVQTSGFTTVTTTEYFGIPTFDLATRLAERDLQITMGAMRRMTVITDRRGAKDLKPGAVFRVQAPQYGIVDVVLRAGKVEDGTVESGQIRVICMQDLFGLPNSTYVAPQPSTWIAPDKTLRPITTRRVWEASYRDLYNAKDEANFNLVDSTAAYVAAVALKPAGLQINYDMWTSTSTSLNSYTTNARGDWAPSGLLSAAMPLSAGPTTVQLYEASDLSMVFVGAPARVDDEELIVTAVNVDTMSVTFARGSLDTIPAAHSANSRVWFYQDFQAEDPTEYAAGQTVYTRLTTHNSDGDLALNLASADSLQLIARQAKPYPPGNLRFNNMGLGAVDPVARPVVASWTHRNRVTQSDRLFAHTYGDITPEAGTTYTVRILTMAGVVKREVAGITANTWTYTDAMIVADGIDALDGLCRFQLWAVRDGIASWQRYDVPLVIIKPGLGMSLGYYLGGEQ